MKNWTARYELGALLLEGLEKNFSGYSCVDFQRVTEEESAGLIVYRAYFAETGVETGLAGDMSTIYFYDRSAPAKLRKVRLYFEDNRIDFAVR